ncbi:MAG TPA: DUF2807 domain-containing protein [Chitinophagaceae bacterium]|jgi:hypothetical protein|nr:DUF2807 domain-containing protein [Chitinophagaceae bacterium]
MKNVISLVIFSLLALPIFLSSCKKEKDTVQTKPDFEKTFDVTGFNRIYAADTFHFAIKKGNEFKVVAKGAENDVNKVQCRIDNNQILNISFEGDVKGNVEITITLPLLVSLNLAGGAKASVTGFQGQPTVLRAVFSGRAKGTISGTGVNTNVEVGGFSELTITGSTGNIYGQISADGKLNAYGLVSTEVDLSLTERAKAYVVAQNVLFGSASDDSRLYYKGNPATTHFETYGNGAIIHE